MTGPGVFVGAIEIPARFSTHRMNVSLLHVEGRGLSVWLEGFCWFHHHGVYGGSGGFDLLIGYEDGDLRLRVVALAAVTAAGTIGVAVTAVAEVEACCAAFWAVVRRFEAACSAASSFTYMVSAVTLCASSGERTNGNGVPWLKRCYHLLKRCRA